MDKIKKRLRRILDRHNPDWDLICNEPIVTWSDNELASVIEMLIVKIETLQERIDQMTQIQDGQVHVMGSVDTEYAEIENEEEKIIEDYWKKDWGY